MRIFAAEDGVNLDEAPLPVERFEVVCERHEIGFWRELVGRVAPIGIGVWTELASFDKCFDPVAHPRKVLGARQRPVRN